MTRRVARWSAGAAVAIAGAMAPIWSWAAATERQSVVVFAAASLKDALDEVGAQWRAAGKQATISYAASSGLARQIESDAPVDVFISADLDWMDYLARRDLIQPNSRSNLLGNRLVLIAPTASPVQTTIAPDFPLAALLGDGRLALGNTTAVPAGKYGKAALQTLGVWQSVAPKVAETENVRAALLLVSRGEAPLGIVYQSDAAADPGVRVVDVFPENTHPPIIYPIALTASSGAPDAPGFLAYLKSPAAQAIFQKRGFIVLR